MSVPIVCNGCGGRLTVPDDYARNKMQCPDCGVMCVIPPRTAAKKQAAVSQPVEEPRFDDEEPAAPTPFAEAPAPAGKGLLTCRSCGELVRAPATKRGKKRHCPVCGAAWPETAVRGKQAPSLPIPPPPDEFVGVAIDEDPDSGNPYGTADPGARRCPDCTELLAPGVAVCVRCGFDLRAGRKVVKEFQRLDQSWDCGMSLQLRVILFLLCQAAALTAFALGFAILDNPIREMIATFVFAWMTYTVMTAFLLGTYEHIHLKRSKSGKIDLTKTWRIGFVRFPSAEIDLRSRFGVICGADEYAKMWDWLMLIVLLGSGIVPAVIFYYFAIHKTKYFVGLCGEHESLEEKIYRGWDREQMLEIQHTLRNALKA
jgi:DNA-directed RNA polymerase subunit M/transcription elongation factor TFIIS